MKFRSVLATGVALACLSSTAFAAGVNYRFTGSLGEVVQDAQRVELAFTSKTGLLLGGTVSSDPARYTGPAHDVTVTGGQVRVCSNPACATASAWGTSASVTDGAYLQLRRAGPAVPGAMVGVDVTIAGQVFPFKATARSAAPAFTALAAAEATAAGEAVDSAMSTFTGWVEAPIAVTGGEYRICAAGGTCGAFTGGASTIRDGDQVQLRVVAGPAGQERTAQVSAEGVSTTFAVSTKAAIADTAPDAFAFNPTSNVDPATEVTSGAVTLTGFDAATSFAVTNGTASVAGGSYATTGTVAPGQAVTLRTTSGTFRAAKTVNLTVGGVSGGWTVTSRAKDTAPDTFSLGAGVTAAEPLAYAYTDTVTLTGFDDATLMLDGDVVEYQLNDGPWLRDDVAVRPGDKVRLRVQALDVFGATTTARMIVGSVEASFTVTTRARDTVPDTITFPAMTDQTAGAEVLSAVRQLTGHDGVSLSVTGGEVRVCTTATCIGGTVGGWATNVVEVADGDYVQIRVTSGSSGETRNARLSYGADQTAIFAVTAKSEIAVSPLMVQRLGGAAAENAYGVASLPNGRIAMVGQTTSPGGAGSNDTFIAVYNADGTLAWRRALGGTAGEQFYGVTALKGGSIAAVGYTSSQGANGNDFLITVYDSSGNLSWRRALGGSGIDMATGVTALVNGGLAFVGYTTSPGSAGSIDSFVAAYNADGSLAWTKDLGGTQSDYGQAITTLPNGNIAVAGYTDSPGTSGSNDAFIAVYSAGGSFLWKKSIGGSTSDAYLGISALSNGNIAAVGYTNSPGSQGSNDAFVVVYSDAGSLAWRQSLGGTGNDVGRSVAPLPDGGLVITGNTNSPGTVGGTDVITAAYSSSGSLLWSRLIGGTASELGYSIASLGGGLAVAGFRDGPDGAGGNDAMLITFPIEGPAIGTYGNVTVKESSLATPSVSMSESVVSMRDDLTVTMNQPTVVMQQPTIPMTRTVDVQP